MRTTIALDDELVAQAQEYTGLKEKSALVHEALKSLIARESGRRLATHRPLNLRRPRRTDQSRQIRPPRGNDVRRTPPSQNGDAGKDDRASGAIHGGTPVVSQWSAARRFRVHPTCCPLDAHLALT